MIRVLFLILFLYSFRSQEESLKYVNPTGKYKLDSKIIKKNGDTYGYFGDIKVIALSKNKILIGFYVCKGAPSYNSGSFIDTLDYKNNIAIYKGDQDDDPSCNMKMEFNQKGVEVELESDNPNFACGFGHAVDSQGYYYKIKGLPKKQEILNDQR